MSYTVMSLIESLPDSNEYLYQEEGQWVVTNEWLCGTFAGRAFIASTKEAAVNELVDYFDRHIGHDSMVGMCVTESGWPNLEAVSEYVEREAGRLQDAE